MIFLSSFFQIDHFFLMLMVSDMLRAILIVSITGGAISKFHSRIILLCHAAGCTFVYGHDLGIDFRCFYVSSHLLRLISPLGILQESRAEEKEEVRHGDQNDDPVDHACRSEFIQDECAIEITKVLHLHRDDKVDVHHILREGKGVSQE